MCFLAYSRQNDYLCSRKTDNLAQKVPSMIYLKNNHLVVRTPSLSLRCARPLLAMIAIVMVVSCSELSREQRRLRRAAEHDYELMMKGKYEKFVREIAYADSMSDDYKAQMIDLVREHASALEQQHGRMTAVKAINDIISDDQAHVFLQVGFADSTCEEIGLPMVKVGKKWKMQ